MNPPPSAAGAHPDLDVLQRREAPIARAPRRPWLPRLTAALLVAGLLGAAYAVLAPVLFPPRLVTLSPVRPGGGPGEARRASFVQAAGWLEADPWPVSVRPLVPGVVETLEVLEGARVKKGETLIATLRNLDLENGLALAKAGRAHREAERDEARTRLDVAAALREQNLEARERLAQRQGELAVARAEVDRASARRKVSDAVLLRARVDLDAQEHLAQAGGRAPTALAAARARVSEAEERVTERRFEEVRYVADLDRINGLLDLAREAVARPRALQGEVDRAGAALARAEASLREAEAQVDAARQLVDALDVRAPADGVVMRLQSAPGARVGPEGDYRGTGEGAGSTGLLDRGTGSLCSIYDPDHLQVRVDLPYADLGGIAAGAEVEVEVKAIPGVTFPGVVDRLVHEADITQAKLQAKVRLGRSDARMRPEMICSVRFLRSRPEPGAQAEAPPGRVLVPTAAVRDGAVMVYDPTGGGRARRVAVRVVGSEGEWTEVEGDLGLGSKVILEAVEAGERVKERP